MIKAVLFDIDGTLIDSNDLHVEAWHQVFSEAGHEIERSAIHDQIGKGGDNLVPALLPHLSQGEQKALADGQGRLFKQLFLDKATPFPAARELLRHVHDTGRKVVLASSASQEELQHYVRLLDIEDIVSASTSIDDVSASKPEPDIFALALKKVGIAAGEAVAVGDTPYDAISAGKAGVATIALLSGGFTERQLATAGAGVIYDDVADLLANYEGSPLSR
jgi:membrane protein